MERYIYIFEESFSYVENGVTRQYTPEPWQNSYFENAEDAIYYANFIAKSRHKEPVFNNMKFPLKWEYKDTAKDGVEVTKTFTIYKEEIVDLRGESKDKI